MRTRPGGGLRTLRGVSSAVILLIAGLALAWLCVRTTMVELLPPADPTIARVAPGAPGPVLGDAADALVRQHGLLSPATLGAVRRAAASAPLDARAFLVLGHQQLLDRQPGLALATLEVGQRLDPRQRVIHLLLLDRYLRTGRYADAAAQFSILARLLGATEGPIAAAMAQMSLQPQTREAVRHTLATDPILERMVLITLAKADTPPATLFALASPIARARAGDVESWGPFLIDRLVTQGRFAEARQVWARIYGLADAQANATIFDPGFRELRASPPFNWRLAAGSLGAADIRNGSLAVDYYGRDSGELASQLLILRPGPYRFGFTVDAGQTDTASHLFWTIACASGNKAVLMNLPVIAKAARHRIAGDVVIPANCPAETLTLRGEAGDLPAPVGLTIRDLDLRASVGAQP